MKYFQLMLILIISISCNNTSDPTNEGFNSDNVESILLEMIEEREKAMIDKDISMAVSQFSDDVTWINSQGYYFEGKEVVEKFHDMLAGNDSLDYYYEAGKPRIRVLDDDNALAYYSWKMFWYRKDLPSDTTKKEIGLMTLNAKRYGESWKWNAITNQYTPWFYDSIDPIPIEH